MNSKQRVHAAMEGRPVDRCPVAALYGDLYWGDHLSELTGAPPWTNRALWYLGVEEHLRLFGKIVEQAPFEILIPMLRTAERAVRERQEFIEKDGRSFRHDTLTDEWFPLDEPTRSGYRYDDTANQAQTVFDIKDVKEQITIVKCEDMARGGELDCLEAVVREYGDEHFVHGGGFTGMLWACTAYVGQLNVLGMLIERPDLIDALCKRLLEADMEGIRRLAETGADAIQIDDAMGSGEMISVAHYERFCLPYVKAMVEEIHRQGMKAIVIYFGKVSDRLEQIASLGADALQVECSMKGYVNDIEAIAEAIGDRVTLFANIDPVWCLQNATEEELAVEIHRQVAAGRKARGFILAPASPITPFTPLGRVQKFIELCKEAGRFPGQEDVE